MEEEFLILRLSFLTFLVTAKVFAITVLVSKDSISFEERLEPKKLMVKEVNTINKACEPLTLAKLSEEKYLTARYINKNTIICMKDVKKYENESVVFDFGGVKIEKKGKVIYENNEFIRIKKLDGSIEQIYKDGRLK